MKKIFLVISEGFAHCKGCGGYKDLVSGFCFDCATKKDDKLLQRNFFQHIYSGFKHLLTINLDRAKIDFNLAKDRVKGTGDYSEKEKRERFERLKLH